MSGNNWNNGHSGYDNRRDEGAAVKAVGKLSVEDYETALRGSKLTADEIEFLRYVLTRPNHVMTTVQAAKDMKWKGWQAANRMSGSIARKIAPFLPVDIKALPYLFFLMYENIGRNSTGHSQFRLHPAFAIAVSKAV